MKLLTRSTRAYLLIASVILLVSIPIFYFAIQRIVKEEMDESLFAQRQEMQIRINNDSTLQNDAVHGFGEIISIQSQSKPDRMYTKVVFDSISNEDIPYRILETALPYKGKYVYARFTRSLIDGDDLIQSIVLVIMLIMGLMIGGMILINRYLSKRLWSPFYKTLAQLRDFELEKSNKLEFPATKIDEFKDLQVELQTLASRSSDAFLSQKSFTENASHEMQTPLAVLQGKLDLLMQTEPLTAEQGHLIAGMADAGQRMNYLNKNLILLSRIVNKQYHDSVEVSVLKELNGCIDLYEDIADENNVSVVNNLQHDILIKANPVLINILLGNLIGNAIRHNREGGLCGIENTGANGIAIWNTGHTALAQEHLYERFHESYNDTAGLGLGLAISKKICEVSGYSLNYKFENGRHYFTVIFQLPQ
jgi:signal transduction histidine kinase